MNDIREQVERVAKLREVYSTARQLVDERQARWREENEQLLAQEACIKAELAEAEARLRELTLDAYVNTGSKKPGPGVGIRMVKRVMYEPAEALAWAKAHDLALALNAKVFETLAKAGWAVGIVRIVEDAQPTIATDLTKALSETLI